MFEAICASYKDAPKACNDAWLPPERNGGIRVTVFWIVFTVIVLILVNVLIVYCYRRHAKREMHDRLHHEVNSAVSAYFALSEGGAPSSAAIKN